MIRKKSTYKILFASFLFGIAFWILQSIQYYFLFTERIRFLIFQAPMSFMDSLIFNIPPNDLIVRLSFILACLIAGILTARFLYIIQNRTIEQENLKIQLIQSQKMETVGVLAGGMAHDFNNLLTTISGYTQLIIYDKSEDHEDYSKLQKIINSVERANEITSRLLTLGSKVQTQKKIINLNNSIVESLKLLTSTIFKMIEINNFLEDAPQIIEADSGQIQQIIMNLVINSRDSMPNGGKITITTETVTCPKECIIKQKNYSNTSTFPKSGDYVLLSIKDNGGGIPKEVIDSIFDPFFTTKQINKGTGLGLTMVYEIVKNHGAYIICYSTVGEGTTFEIYFPLSKKEIEPEQSSVFIETKSGSETILVIDDEENIRDITKTALNRKGYNVFTSSTGEDGLDIYNNNKVDLVVLDIIMPGMGGIKCLSKLLEINSKAKVIAISGFSNKNSNDFLKLGAKRFVSKPFDINYLLLEIRNTLDQKIK